MYFHTHHYMHCSNEFASYNSFKHRPRTCLMNHTAHYSAVSRKVTCTHIHTLPHIITLLCHVIPFYASGLFLWFCILNKQFFHHVLLSFFSNSLPSWLLCHWFTCLFFHQWAYIAIIFNYCIFINLLLCWIWPHAETNPGQSNLMKYSLLKAFFFQGQLKLL